MAHITGKDVVEIGSGCGLVGITAAVLGARSVTLTDILAQQSHLDRNIEINRPHWGGLCTRVESGVLQFGDFHVSNRSVTSKCHESAENVVNYDVVLGADIGYDLSLHEPIARTLSYLLGSDAGAYSDKCSNSSAREIADSELKSSRLSDCRTALLMEEIRWHDIHRWYIETLLTQGFDPSDDVTAVTTETTEAVELVGKEMSRFTDKNSSDLCDEHQQVLEVHEKNQKARQIQCISSFPFDKINDSEGIGNNGSECLTYDEILKNIKGRKKSSIHLLHLNIAT
jgi:Lysine methyltransferase